MLVLGFLETWLSGRKHLTANEAGFKSPRRFESVRLRSQHFLSRDRLYRGGFATEILKETLLIKVNLLFILSFKFYFS